MPLIAETLILCLLAFLLVDAVQEGLEGGAALAASYQGAALFLGAAAAAYLALEVTGQWLRAARARRKQENASAGAVLALLIAIGIGLHNFGEGLAIGAAFALGEAALGTLLIIGFTLHNTTEGLAILSPIAKERPRTDASSSGSSDGSSATTPRDAVKAPSCSNWLNRVRLASKEAPKVRWCLSRILVKFTLVP